MASYKRRKLGEISPYSDYRRWESYEVISELSERLWRQARSISVIATHTTNTFPGFPKLVLEDRDNDGRAEFYSYNSSRGSEDTREFGAFFDLSGDGKPDWIVFNGGPMLTKPFSFFWFTYQGVDRNGDGVMDIRIVNAIDIDGDGHADKGVSAWVYDDDFDGRVDRAEHMRDGVATPIKPENGRLHIGFLLRPKAVEQPRIGEPFDALESGIARDIVRALEKSS